MNVCLKAAALAFLGLLVGTATGCSTLAKKMEEPSAYKRPPLFSPSLRLARYALDHPDYKAPKKKRPARQLTAVFIDGPEGPLLASAGRQYILRIGDIYSQKDDEMPMITIDPAGIASAPKKEPSSIWTTVTIDGGKLHGLEEVTVKVRSRGVLDTLSTVATIQGQEIQAMTEQRFDVGSGLADITSILPMAYEDVAEEFGRTFASCFMACSVNLVNNEKEPIIVYGSSLEAEVRFLMAEKDVLEHFGPKAFENPTLLPTIKIPFEGGGMTPRDYLDWTWRTRALSFSDVLAIFTYQRHADPRQRWIDRLKMAGAIAAPLDMFVTHTDYAAGVALFTGVFTPQLEKLLLWDVMLHVQNLQSRSLREIEEIPGYGQKNRVIFFPRRPIYGIVQDLPVYISDTRIEPVRVQATFVEKLGPDLQASLKKQDEEKAAAIEAAAAGVEMTPEILAARAALDKARAEEAERRAKKAEEQAKKKAELDALRSDFIQSVGAAIRSGGVPPAPAN